MDVKREAYNWGNSKFALGGRKTEVHFYFPEKQKQKNEMESLSGHV